MKLQQFVTNVIEAIGGVVDPVEYALCHVLIPESYQPNFQNKTELELVFDYEVAEEHPQSEFVTFGSFILDQILKIVDEKTVCAVRFAEVERRQLANPIKKMTDFLQNERSRLTIINERSMMAAWAVFQFHVTYVSDEKEEHSNQIWMNLITGKRSDAMKREQSRIFYQSDPLYDEPVPQDLKIETAFLAARRSLELEETRRPERHLGEKQLKKDLERIENYYRELERENEHRSARKGISEEKVGEITAKTKAIKIEMEKQVEEIKKKYQGHTEIRLDHGIIYFIPMLQYDIELSFRAERDLRTLYYNFITQTFE
ncbi:hypothetical protein ABWW58_15200 [Sporolactobacillus sp. STCC-11]|uniref:hypothetical protein n=1 Tax=Sporolactobacillus caesalpiniae TaxID=3230362 RepID=UPI003390CB39